MTFGLSPTAQAVLDADGPLLVLGGPGAGKTTLSLLKAQKLIPELQPGQDVLFLSFSRAAVHQVLVRCRGILTTEERKRIVVKTYHAFAMDILKAHGRLLTGRPARILFPRDARLAKSAFQGDWAEEVVRRATEDGQFAFDQFAASSADLLARSACVRELLSDRYPVIILDEFQDTDDAQWALLQHLAVGSLLLTLADPDQRIFEYDDRIDPRRLDQLRELLQPAEFDLGGENHRSPQAGILSFADAVLHSRPLPTTKDVHLQAFYPNGFESMVHAGVVWSLSAIHNAGIKDPSVAVLTRANSFVSDLSVVLGREHTFNGQKLRPVDHHVAWDAELTAASAKVVAGILEWPQTTEDVGVAETLGTIADFYDLKNAERPSELARTTAATYRKATRDVRDGKSPRPKAAKELMAARQAGIRLNGDPVTDWLRARDVIAASGKLREIANSARFVRLFRATEDLGSQLAEQWLASGTYGAARDIVRRTLDLRQVMSSQADPRGVLLMTMHKSKGKEFDGVILVEGAWRSKFFDEERESPPYEASRRLLRVGITRARHRVLILRPRGSIPLINEY